LGALTLSIIITNYNKAAYVAAAVDSALGQTWRSGPEGKTRVEVIVVDDGSSDTSLAVLGHYRSQVTLIRKKNGGQASAMNTGFAVSSGEIVLFLDSDDMLLPDTAERLAAVWSQRTVKVHFRLQQIGTDGKLLGGALLPPYRALPSGDLRPLLWRFGFYPSPPTTGNAFARRFLQQVMPIAEMYRRSADTPLIGAAPLFGEIGVLDGIGGFWRRHEGNISVVGIDCLLDDLRFDQHMVHFLTDLQDRIAAESSPRRQFRAAWPSHLKEQLIVAKFGRACGRARSATIAQIAGAYLAAVFRWPEYGPVTRMKFAGWCIAMVILPRALLAKIPGIAGRSIRL
jgi:glycosyltransferase involved in cell wall biosynthesis